RRSTTPASSCCAGAGVSCRWRSPRRSGLSSPVALPPTSPECAMASGLTVALRALRSIVSPAGTRRPDEGIGPLLAASGAYYTSPILLLLGGLISMPIMTRLLSKDEYGLLSWIFTIVTLLVVAGGFGLGEAAVRLYGEHRAEGRVALARLCDTL